MSDWKQFKNLQDASASVVRSLEGEVATWKQRAEAAEQKLRELQAEIGRLREETTIKQEDMFIVCQKCRSIVPPQMMKYQMDYCPNCGRKITEKGGAG